MTKFYNPFKPHIIAANNVFYIRILTIAGFWFYDSYDKGKIQWWQKARGVQHFLTVEEALEEWEKAKTHVESKKNLKPKFIKSL